MIRSMTAYASAESTGPAGTLSCELRTVNHRYLELSPRLPDDLRAFESLLRERVAKKLSRGKLDLTVRRNSDARGESLQVNRALLARLSELNVDMVALFPGMQVQLTELLRFPGVMQQAEIDPEAQQVALFDVLERALDALTATREREGEKLAAILHERLDAIEKVVIEVRGWMPEIRAALRTRLETRLADLNTDVDEELDRLSTHIGESRRVLGLNEPVGRRLDFLMQEFNREANTLGSKSVDARSTNAAVELKVLIEQMREQVQNIE